MTNKRITLVQVAAFQTTDGKTHTTRSAAATHEANIQLRGFFNRYASGTARNADKIEFGELVNLMARHRIELADLLKTQISELSRIEKLEASLAKRQKAPVAP